MPGAIAERSHATVERGQRVRAASASQQMVEKFY
jgi:hypothetical protein